MFFFLSFYLLIEVFFCIFPVFRLFRFWGFTHGCNYKHRQVSDRRCVAKYLASSCKAMSGLADGPATVLS